MSPAKLDLPRHGGARRSTEGIRKEIILGTLSILIAALWANYSTETVHEDEGSY